MLNFLRENEGKVQDIIGACAGVLSEARHQLKVLDPVLGDKELVRLVAVEHAKLSRGWPEPTAIESRGCLAGECMEWGEGG